MKLIVTGGLGFIGSAVVRLATSDPGTHVLNIDAVTYAALPSSVESAQRKENYSFQKIDICDLTGLQSCFKSYQPDAVLHLAAESHVDNSILAPSKFMQTNVIGTQNLLEVSRRYLESRGDSFADTFRFHHVSTDEVFGDLSPKDPPFEETNNYCPSSPYSASKAASDHLVRAWHRTFDLPVLITNCSNNYGPYQHGEKLIPKIILNALTRTPIPVYGDGLQIRDWLFVEDHARALLEVLRNGRVGETYNIGGSNEVRNIDVVKTICTRLDELRPFKTGTYHELITYVDDRPGHDRRYAINSSKIKRELNWCPVESFETGITKTIQWYLGSN